MVLKLFHRVKFNQIIFIYLSFCLCTLAGVLYFYNIRQLKLSNYFISNKALEVKNLDFNDVNKKDISDLIIYNLISDVKENDYFMMGIYQKGNPEIPNIIKGRFFEKNDYFKNKKVAVIGKDVEKSDQCIKSKNKEFIMYHNESYKVIGIIGYNFDCVLNGVVLINMDMADFKEGTTYFIDTKNSNTKKKLISNLQENQLKNKNMIRTIMGDDIVYKNRQIKIQTVIIYIFAHLLLMTAAVFNIRYLREEISIKKILGFDFKYLFIKELKKVFHRIAFSFILTILSFMPIFHYLFYKYGIKNYQKMLVYDIYLVMNYILLVSVGVIYLYYKKYETMR